MRTRIYNARIITMANGTDILEGEIHIEDERIAFVGAGEDAKKLIKDTNTVFDREIDAYGNVVMPGFKDAHTFCNDFPAFICR